MLDRVSEPEQPERHPTGREILINMLIQHELDREAAERCAETIIESLVDNGYCLTYMNKAHHMEHAICDCGCGTVAVVFCDEDNRAFASGQLFPEYMIKFCNEIINTCQTLLPNNSP